MLRCLYISFNKLIRNTISWFQLNSYVSLHNITIQAESGISIKAVSKFGQMYSFLELSLSKPNKYRGGIILLQKTNVL